MLAGTLWWVWRKIGILLPKDPVVSSLSIREALRGSALGRQLASFAAALLLCHTLLGLAAFGLARLTETAFPNKVIASRHLLVAGWFALIAGLVLAANATWHPSSNFGSESIWLRYQIGGSYPVQVAAMIAAGFVLWLLVRVAPRLRASRPAAGIVAAIGGAALLAALAMPNSLSAWSAAPATSAPHVVIIGIDSLRSDLAIPRHGAADTPNIADFLAGSHRFSDATTPLARTFGAWVTILTGRHPVVTNARVNLMPRRLVRPEDTLADALRGHGYSTVYATDEVRFANFDESFGFDQLISPPVGAADFLLGHGGDMPLVNLLARTKAGKLLFPSNYANRAAYVTYQPRQFVERLDDELLVDGPTFLSIHLTLAHWPYAWAGTPVPRTPPAYRTAYAEAVAEVDRQFQQVLQVLAEKRVLNNAIVVLLSDHGEALGGETDSMLRQTGTDREIWDSLWGHGTSVMSPHQYGVLLAMRGFGRANLPGAPGMYDWPVSLEDLRPTLEQYVSGRAPAGVDGVSLLPFLSDPAMVPQLDARVRFTETDFNTPSTLAGRYEASGIFQEGASYYELDPASSWVQFRRDRLPVLLAQKQRAAFSTKSLLAAVPDPGAPNLRYLFTDRHDPRPRSLEARPDAKADPEAARLWDALQARFPGELPPPPGSP